MRKQKTSTKTKTRIKNNLRKDKHNIAKEIATKNPKKRPIEHLNLLLNPEDTQENPLTYERLMDWLSRTGWVEGYIRKKISPMDVHLIDDFTQRIWICILTVNKDTMMEVWYHGKGKFVNFLKCVINLQLHSRAQTYKENKHFHHTHCTLSDDQWQSFLDAEQETLWTDTYPVKFSQPGSRSKQIIIEHEDLIIRAEEELITYE